MKLAVIVTEFPKSTETFIYRDLTEFKRRGIELKLIHLAPFRTGQKLHGFASHLRDDAGYHPFLSVAALICLARALLGQPVLLLRTMAQICREFSGHPKMLLKSLALLPKALVMAKELRAWGADHVHAEFAGHPATAAWISRRFGGPDYSVSCRAHDIFRTQKLLPRKLGEASAVRTVSAYGRQFLKERLPNGDAMDIQVIHSSVDVHAIDTPFIPLEPLAPRLLYVGALEPKKGVEYLIEALAGISDRLGDWSCDIIGSGPSREALLKMASDRGLGARLIFHGAMPFEDVARAYARAQLCLCPSVIGPGGRMEGIPNVVIEALANRKPVIATNISGIPELVTDYVHGRLVPQRDANALAEAIIWMLANPDAARSMALAGRARVEEEFDLRANALRQMQMFGVAPLSAEPARHAHGTKPSEAFA